MADYYGEDPRQRKSYFPNTGAGNQQFPLRPGVAEGQARIRQLQSQPRPQLATYTLPSGGTARVPSGSRPPIGYSQIEGQSAGNLTSPYALGNPQPQETTYPNTLTSGPTSGGGFQGFPNVFSAMMNTLNQANRFLRPMPKPTFAGQPTSMNQPRRSYGQPISYFDENY